jgi:hypothetical protein
MRHKTVGRMLALGDEVGPEYGPAVETVATANLAVTRRVCRSARRTVAAPSHAALLFGAIEAQKVEQAVG